MEEEYAKYVINYINQLGRTDKISNLPGGDSHIAFYTGKEDDKYYYVLGGNQNSQTCVKGYLKKDLIYMRWPVKA